MAAAFVLFRRPPSLWTPRHAPLTAAARQDGAAAPSAVRALIGKGLAASRATVSGRRRRGQVARSLVMSGEVDETNDDPDPVDPEQV